MADVENGTVVPKNDEDDFQEEETGLSAAESGADVIPVQKRHCTDVLFLLVFLAYLAGMVGLSIFGLQTGDPGRLVFGANHAGQLCGGDEQLDKRFISYPRVEEDVLLSGFLSGGVEISDLKFFGVCVEKCPLAGDYVCTDAGEAAVQAGMTALSQGRDTVINACLANTGPCFNTEIRRSCFENLFDTTSVFFRCLPEYVYEVEILPESQCTRFKNVTLGNGDVQQLCVTYREVSKVTREQPTAGNLLFDTFNTFAVTFQRYTGDVVRARTPILVSGLGVSSLIGFAFIVSLYCCVGVMVWVTVLSSVIMSIVFTSYCYFKAGILSGDFITSIAGQAAGLLAEANEVISENVLVNLGVNDTLPLPGNITSGELPAVFQASLDYTDEYTYVAYAATIFTVLLVIIVFAMFDRILRAIEIFHEASKCIRKNVFIAVLPFFSMLFMFGAAALWAYCTAYIATAGDFKLEQLNRTVSIDPESTALELNAFNTSFSYMNLVIAYMFLGLLWILNFISGVTTMTVSGAVLQWFWNNEVASDGANRRRFPLARSFWITIRYHLGTVAFGSLLIAIITFIRYLAAYMQRQMQKMGNNSRVARILCCAVQCFLRCVQRFIEFVSRSGFIYCAMYGTTFCTSTKTAFFAVTSNVAQVALVTFLGDLIQRFGQVFITVSAGFVCWVWVDSAEYQFGGEKQLYNFITPVFVSMVLAWFAAAEVLTAYDITVDTILMSYLQDKRLGQYKADHKSKSSDSMHAFMDKHKLKDPKLIKQASMLSIH